MESVMELLTVDPILEVIRSHKNTLVCVSAALGVFYVVFVRKLPRPTNAEYTKRIAMPEDAPYSGEEEDILDLSSIPPVEGWLRCKLVRGLVNTNFKKYVMDPHVFRALRLGALRNLVFPEIPTYLPLVRGGSNLYKKEAITDQQLWDLAEGSDSERDGFCFLGIAELITQYKNGQITPELVINNLLNCLKGSESEEKPQRYIVEYKEEVMKAQAIASTLRWKRGKPLSVFDGIPIAVKDEFFVADHNVRCGLPRVINQEGHTIQHEQGLVRMLREGGAIIVGMTNMHQFGTGVTGINQSSLHGTPRNPYNRRYCTGGSSSGSAGAVASGLSVMALGTDGGGSIRMPAVTCGLVGLKATYGAYPHTGKLSGTSVGHTGALCSSVLDAAISHAFLAGKDSEAPGYSIQPPVTLPNFSKVDMFSLSELKVGVDSRWVENAGPELRSAYELALQCLRERYGMEVVEIHIPEKTESHVAHASTISAEMSNNAAFYRDIHHSMVNIDVLMALELARETSAHDYLQAAKQRTRAIKALKYIFSCVDVVLSPPYGDLMPELTPQRDAYGYIDLAFTYNCLRYVGLMNFTGVPAISLPVTYTSDNRPIGVQLFASWWKEDVLFKVAYAIEKCVHKQKPEVYYDITQ